MLRRNSLRLGTLLPWKCLRFGAVSTASCAPFCNGNPDARTSMALASKTEIPSTFMSLNFTLVLTMAFASRHTLASVFSVGTALARRRPDLGHDCGVCPTCRGVRHIHTEPQKCATAIGDAPRATTGTRGQSGIYATPVLLLDQSANADGPGSWQLTEQVLSSPEVEHA